MDFFREGLRLELVCELPEFVEIDTRLESEGMGDRLRCEMASGRGGLANAGANCSVHRFLKGNAELPRALFQQSCQIIVEGQGRPHFGIIPASIIDVKTSELRFEDLQVPSTERVWVARQTGRFLPTELEAEKSTQPASA